MKVAIADDSSLIYSDDYRSGWVAGFRGISCETRVFDISPLRRSKPRGSVYSTKTTGAFGKMIAMNIASWGADLVWCHHGLAASMDSTFLDTLKKKGIRTAVYLCDEPYEIGETARYSSKFDAVFSMDLCTVDVHNKARGKFGTYYLPPAVDVGHFNKMYPYGERVNIARFLGNADLIPRRDWLEPVERLVQTDIRFFPHRQVKGRPIAKGHPLWVGSNDHPDLYATCTVGLNVHRSPVITKECWNKRVRGRKITYPSGFEPCKAMPEHEGTGFWNDGNYPASHVNPRFFEMAACGTLVVSDSSRSELRRMFPFAPQAKDPQHFAELVLYYMQNLEEAEFIGKQCALTILKRHTYQHRALEVLIRLGFKELLAADRVSSLGEPEDWLSPQDLNVLEVKLSSERIGHSERWSPQFGMSLISQSGNPKEANSIDVRTLW